MPRIAKLTTTLIVFLVLCHHTAVAFETPKRNIEIKPYVHFLFPDNLLRYEGKTSLVKDDAGVGFGLKIRTEVAGKFGFTVNASITGGETENDSRNDPVFFTTGPYYALDGKLGRVTFELTFGVIGVADTEATLLLPAMEYSRALSDRIRLSGELSLPVANDWLYDYNVEESAKSFSLSLGLGFVF